MAQKTQNSAEYAKKTSILSFTKQRGISASSASGWAQKKSFFLIFAFFGLPRRFGDFGELCFYKHVLDQKFTLKKLSGVSPAI